MKRFLAAAIFIAMTIVVMVMAARMLPVDSATAAVQRRLADTLGAQLAPTAEAKFTLIPFPMIHLPDVSLVAEDGNLLVTCRGLTARLSLLALLRGEYQPSSITLDAPDIVIAIQKDGHLSWPGVRQIVDAVKAGDQALPKIHLSRGSIAWQDLRDGSRIVLSDFNGSLGIGSKSALTIDGSFTWRRETISVEMEVADLAAFGEGRWSEAEARFTSPPGQMRFRGRVNTISGLQLDGDLAVDSPAADRFAVWLANDWNRSHWPAGELDLRAQLKRVPEALSLLNMKLSLGETSATGAAVLKMNDGRPLLQGTLGADTLDLTPLLKRLLNYGVSSAGWSRQDFKISSFEGFDSELRVSADKILFGKITLEDSALLADIHDANLSVRLEEARTLGGAMSATIRAVPNGPDLDLRMTVSGRDLAMSQIFELIGTENPAEGRSDIQADISGRGPTTEAIARSLNGTIILNARDGAVHGINIAQQLQRLERSPLALGSMRGGRTSFSRLYGELSISSGIGLLRNLRLESPDLLLGMSGSIDVGARSLQLAGTAARRDKEPPFVLPFTVTGDWRAPLVRPDVDMLLRRSDAAAPLFPSATMPAPAPVLP
ncbi:cell envelope biogenesis protein AsmA [Agaricicola taiwanensis]|uniref:Cell envelope biogenesis protein AsmA n=1 Tax=Agaricicola taiwanensis TaxID=591372 RepID=A0A8J2VK70_9RHOB|nr:AsmA family protein [Agaricicola taiwanensis]GGE33941.1 cell envelope biogenesis protein AsmA [Agaricicola taiwanensis]